MSTSINDTLRQAPDKARQLILQWPKFNQKIYLQGELGLNNDDFSQLVPGGSLESSWNTQIAPGKKSGTSLEPYRHIAIRNINLANLLDDKVLAYFIMTQAKPGLNINYDNQSELNSNADICICSSSVYDSIRIESIYAPYVRFDACEFRNSTFQTPYFRRAHFQNCIIDNCTFNGGIFNYAHLNYVVGYPVINSRITYSTFSGVFFGRVNMGGSYIEHCNFVNCDLRHRTSQTIEPETNVTTARIINSTRFIQCNLNITHAVAPAGTFNQIANSQFDRCVFAGYDVISHDFLYNNLGNSRFTGPITFADINMQYCDFSNVIFDTMPSFIGNGTISGCDFSGSNIGQYWTKDEFRTMFPGQIDSCTIWVDGTTF
jgi:uncharacterized protein YjbI with pentapeptide repeats